MQTFLPYADFARSAGCLDRTRLGKQRVETLQLLRALTIPDYGWQSHPATRMWMGYVPALTSYGLAMADAWIRRGGSDSTRANILEFAPWAEGSVPDMPPWLGREELHESHRSNLVRKDPAFYGPRFPGCCAGLEYLWPEPERVLLPEEPDGDRVWVLRLPATELAGFHALLGDSPGSGTVCQLPFVRIAKSGRKSPKRQRQAGAFTSALHVGDTVLVDVHGGHRFAVLEVSGGVLNDGAETLVRPAILAGFTSRSRFREPALLQDPRDFFAVPAPPSWH